jgi:hypothetical protein
VQRFCLKHNQLPKQYMKYVILFGVIAVVFSLASCKKNVSPEEDNASIIGKWNIVTDSSHVGIGANNHLVVYTGKEGDYFNFSSNGKLYIKENIMLDTLQYNLTSDTTMTIDSFLDDSNGTSQTCTITNPAPHNTVISTAISYTPGGTFGRKVTLDK